MVATLVLRTVDDQPGALRELQRVLRPHGRLLFIEHVRSDDGKLARLHCNRSVLGGIRNAGFDVTQLEHDTLKHAPPLYGR